MTATLTKKKKSGIKLRKTEQVRLERVRTFLAKVKNKLEKTKSQCWYDQDCPTVIDATCIDTKRMQIYVGAGMEGGKFYHCLAPGWGPYYDEEADTFEEWFADFKNDFFTVKPLKV